MKFTDKFVLVPVERYERLTLVNQTSDRNEQLFNLFKKFKKVEM